MDAAAGNQSNIYIAHMSVYMSSKQSIPLAPMWRSRVFEFVFSHSMMLSQTVSQPPLTVRNSEILAGEQPCNQS